VAHTEDVRHRLTLGVVETEPQELEDVDALLVLPPCRLAVAQKLPAWLPAALALTVRACTVAVGEKDTLPVRVAVLQAEPAARLALGVEQAQEVGENVPVGQYEEECEGLWLGVVVMLLLLLTVLLTETVPMPEAALLADTHSVGESEPLSLAERVKVELEMGLSVPLLVVQKLRVEVVTDEGDVLKLVVRVALGQLLGLPLALMVPVEQEEGEGVTVTVKDRLAPPELLAQRVGVRVAEEHPEKLPMIEGEGRVL
jgi:hypothetical protein